MTTVEDSILTGKLVDKQLIVCEVCAKRAKVVRILGISLPKGIDEDHTILFQRHRKNPKVRHIGVTCGCYAKFHRQIAHIQDKMGTR